MSIITITVQPDDGEPFEVKAGTRDVYLWEKSNRGKTFAQLMADTAIGDIYQIAHIAARRQGLFHGDLLEFTQTCELEVDFESEKGEGSEQELGPFGPDPSDVTSSPSPSSPASPRRSGPKKATGR